ncbi:MAG TPA: helix-turn-helix domain-containing GNAT family N-acetyltransferase [Mucilaginibacter sp.]|nr:helix-turn-helix domain-containing GNAT family N-acetyltransferase [Mucilaginibacter sp.]
MIKNDPHINAIRSFNRFYTNIIGLLDQHLLDSKYSLAEARIIYEIYYHDGIQASHIMESMHIDKSYLSRILKKLERERVITRERSAGDGRAVLIRLTEKGKKEFARLNMASDKQVAGLIEPLAGQQRRELVGHMSAVRKLVGNGIGHKIDTEDVQIRTNLLPGDLGYLAYLHGRIYAEECGYGLNFEGYVLESLGEFAHGYHPEKDRAWICEHKGQIVGFLVGVHRGDSVQLRYFILLPEYRGLGLGRRLMDMFMACMRELNVTKAYLWTTNEQHTATDLYKKYGFKLAEEKSSIAFDKQLTEQRYDLELAVS